MTDKKGNSQNTGKKRWDPLKDFRVDPSKHGSEAGSAPAMLRVRLLTAGGEPLKRDRWAFSYPNLKRVELDEGKSELIMRFADDVVTVRGPKMASLFDLVSQHQIALIEVVNQAEKRAKNRPLTSVDAVEIRTDVSRSRNDAE